MDLKSSISNSIFLHPIYSSETGDVAFSEVLYTIPDGYYEEQFLDMTVSDEIIMESALNIVKKLQNNKKNKMFHYLVHIFDISNRQNRFRYPILHILMYKFVFCDENLDFTGIHIL